MVGDGLDEETHLRMELRAKRLNREMTRLLQELEQGPPESSAKAWGALLWAALQHWHFWALVGVLVLLLGPWFIRRRRNHGAGNNGEDEEGQVNDDGNEEEVVNEQGIGHANDAEEDNNVVDDHLRWLLEEHIQWPVQDLKKGCERTTILMDNFILIIRRLLSNTFYPLTQRAIGVGSAFEGWSPREEDIVYRVLVPLIPPQGHTFHLELDTSGHIPGRNFHIRVELVCTCTSEQQNENVQCFIHPSEEQQRGNEEPSFLNTLCTRSYLDAEKTARWFRQLVAASWRALPQSQDWHLMLLPSSRSCKFKLSRCREALTVEVLFGVREGNSDIFVSSQHTETLFTPSTMWPETYAVAEMKFFRHITSQAPEDSWHLKCLQLLARALLGIDFSTYTLKTIVMHLLNTVPVSGWHRRYFLLRLAESIEYLCSSLEEKRLDHFILGNQSVPQVIRLPPDVQYAEPLNLFHHLVQDPAAHSKAMNECHELEERLQRMLQHGR
ncbi:inositol 1,4,5-trisphosphate receptor-interacting protein-like 1 [Willisornis vidua]|uniref:Inositol 1,4,5-trisphosphate receptor-interacting protein-like 1 n=1 Tax=Willisornis vidua TaxID=1566151 RepID=A0ABQ9D7N8_9PASS|nr:inositol 1,4,5-trisphosphate receptor-interacting protein-like 1 [Willisornis vidua]